MRARLPSSAVSPLPVASGPARVAESVDAADLKSAPFGGVSSNLTPGTEGADPWGIPGRRSKLPVLANEAKGSSVARRLRGAATVNGDQRSEPVGKRSVRPRQTPDEVVGWISTKRPDGLSLLAIADTFSEDGEGGVPTSVGRALTGVADNANREEGRWAWRRVDPSSPPSRSIRLVHLILVVRSPRTQ